jgi:hypothetical protein
MTRRAGRLAAVVGAVVVALGFGLAGAAPAFAHNYLVSSTPEAGSIVSDIPQFTLAVTTNEPLLDVSGEAAGFALQVSDADGGYYGDGCLSVEGSTLSTRAELGESGEYTVGWQVVSADGHTVDGEFEFTWEPPIDYVAAAAASEPPACNAAGGSATPSGAAVEERDNAAAVSGTDLLWVLGTVVVVGAVLFGTLLLLTRRRGSGARTG